MYAAEAIRSSTDEVVSRHWELQYQPNLYARRNVVIARPPRKFINSPRRGGRPRETITSSHLAFAVLFQDRYDVLGERTHAFGCLLIAHAAEKEAGIDIEFA